MSTCSHAAVVNTANPVEMAMALEARGFGLSRQPTSFIDYPVESSDLAATAALFALGAAYFMIYYTGYGAISVK